MPGGNDLAVLLRTLRPVLDAEQFVYAVVGEPPAGLTPFAGP
jgi:hypothetical protein